MNHVSITNPDLTQQETTKLTADVSAGSDVELSVENNQGFALNELVVIPTEGEERCEKCKITVKTGNDKITVETLRFNHLKGDEVRKTPYDQVSLYYLTGEDYLDDEDYTAIGTWVDVNFDDLVTYIDHDAGTADTWYKAGFRHSISTKESGRSDAFQVTADIHYCTLNQILEEAGMVGNRYIAPGRVFRLRANSESEVKGSVGGRYSLPLSVIPDIVRTATKLIAAGWLLWQEFGTDAEGTVRDGMATARPSSVVTRAIPMESASLAGLVSPV